MSFPLLFDILSDWYDVVPANTSIMGLDVGSKTIGIAISDTTHVIATAVTTIKRKKFTQDAAQLLDLIQEHQVGALVIGLPKHMSGEEGVMCQSVRQFGRNMLKRMDEAVPVLFHDERLSSIAADNVMLEADMSRQKRSKSIDKIAACIILQSVLDQRVIMQRG